MFSLIDRYLARKSEQEFQRIYAKVEQNPDLSRNECRALTVLTKFAGINLNLVPIAAFSTLSPEECKEALNKLVEKAFVVTKEDEETGLTLYRAA